MPSFISPSATPPAETHSLILWLTASAGALGGLLFGYDWVVIGGAKPFYEIFFHITSPILQGWAMSCAIVGCFFGATTSGLLSSCFGRRRMLTLSALIFALTSIGTGFAPTFTAFVLFRILGGYAIGLASGVSPMYIAEISPAHLRGRLVSLNQLAIVFGILSAQIVNWLIAHPVPVGSTPADLLGSWNAQWGWRWMFSATAIPSLLFLVSTFFIPESPRWLVLRGRETQAIRTLSRLGGSAYARRVLDDIHSANTTGDAVVPFLQELRRPGIPRLLCLGVFLAVLQQWCGINVIFNYAQEVFAAAGFPISSVLFNIVITGTINVVFTLLALSLIDRFGRRLLLFSGLGALVLFYSAFGLAFQFHLQGLPMLVLVLAAIASYALSLAPVTWVVIAEIYPNRIRSTAMSIAVGALWIACFLLTYTFPILNAALGAAGAFWTYAAICAAGFIWLYPRLPETRGKSLEQLERALHLDTEENTPCAK
jgi:SP family sugar porter-like MFS transporter